jgi:hypothetical protein
MICNPVHALFTLAMSLLAFAWTGAAAQDSDDPRIRWRERVEAAKLLSLPKPPAGIRNLGWHDLSPPGWDPGQFLRKFDLHGLSKDDPRAIDAMAQIRREWDAAPTVPATDDAPIRLAGSPVLLEPGDGLSKTVLLVPYHGDGMEKPPPPANQMILAVFKRGLPRNMESVPIWITGRIYPVRTPTPYGKAAYLMPEGKWQKYPYPAYPMPPYQPLH